MLVKLPPGKYVVAVSGGVDSMALLHALQPVPGVSLLVAHVDHGIRPDSLLDQALVAELAAHYELPFFTTSLTLGAAASEATARQARYDYLEKLVIEQGAAAIVTAHHQDDALETAIINLVRGTGRRGLSALNSTVQRRRPLLDISKADILAYAQRNQLQWREDSTNNDQRYLRNYIRQKVVAPFSAAERQQFVSYITRARHNNYELAAAMQESLKVIAVGPEIDRQILQTLPAVVAKELLMAWWQANGFRNYEAKTVIRAYQALCRGQTGAITPLKKPFIMKLGRSKLALYKHER